MLTSAQIRQSFLDFFASKEHAVVPSSSLMPDSPNLLFTNAGMNQFVPIFLGQVQCPYRPGRAADTQKCIRAGGKHNDLDDVGLDTYHHTFFEMLGNWSFGDYFKKEAIDWAWELVVNRWKFPANRLYATVYAPDKSKGDPSEFDQEAWDFWAEKFRAAGLDPAVQIVNGNKKDNFWMMGDTGPCGPCSELHVDLTPEGDTRGSLVNTGDSRCIEIWNLVFIQFNANPDGTFSPLPAQHVDTGMGFERVTSIIQGTKNFTDFAHAKISNYETDIFRPLFDEIEKLSGQKYGATLPKAGSTGDTEQEKVDVAFRVIADHIRTLSFAVADGIAPGNTDRNYVLRRILRRAVRYGRTLGFRQPFFYKLVDVLAENMGGVFPELRARRDFVKATLKTEEESFNRTLDTGLQFFEYFLRLIEQARLMAHQIQNRIKFLKIFHADPDPMANAELLASVREIAQLALEFFRDIDRGVWQRLGGLREYPLINKARELHDILAAYEADRIPPSLLPDLKVAVREIVHWFDERTALVEKNHDVFPAEPAFVLYDTYGFPLDLTELMARERGLKVDVAGFEQLMEGQRTRARAAQKKQIIELSQVETTEPTRFLGYDALATPAQVLEVVSIKDKTAVILDASVCYAEMGGQLGDTGELAGGGALWRVLNTQKSGNTWLHFIEAGDRVPEPGMAVDLRVDTERRSAIERHHTVTHLLHWALHEVVSKDATQKGSFVGPDKLTFDFNSAALTPGQVRDIERLVNERIVENAPVSWTEAAFGDVKGRPEIMQFFGDKYGDVVRVVQIGGQDRALNGWSMELCGGTHTRATGEIGLFRIGSEAAIAAGVRRIEAAAGLAAYAAAVGESERLKALAGRLGSPLSDLEKRVDAMMAQQKELEKQLDGLRKKQAAATAAELMAKAETWQGVPAIVAQLHGASGDELQSVADALKGQFAGVAFLAGVSGEQVALVASVSPEFTGKFQAGKIIQTIAPVVGGKGGGRPDTARGAGKEIHQVGEALVRTRALLGAAV
jgi:alanyl-tRNA synthetase